jgi:fatty-acyl-CoA synthase
VTFGRLYAESCAYARAYRARGVGSGSIVLVALRHGPQLFSSFLGAMLAGAVPSFMPFPSPKQDAAKYWRDHETLFRRIKPALLVTFDANVEAARAAIDGFPVETLLAAVPESSAASTADVFPGLTADCDTVACLQHSSGTTGRKKGVALTHAAIARHVETYAAAIDLSPTDCIASWLPLYHDMGFITSFLMPLLTGTHVVALDPFEWVLRPARLFDIIERYRATLCWQPNFAFSHLVNTTKASARHDLSSMRAFVNCSEPCKPATFERFVARFSTSGVGAGHMSVCYAMAENVFAVTQTAPGRVPSVAVVDAEAFARGVLADPRTGERVARILSCGPLLDGVAIEIRDDAGHVLPERHIGQIALRSAFAFSGYYLQPDVTAQRVRDGWYLTGDLGFLRDGELYVTGRADDMIVVNGRNYYAHEIEEIVTLVPGTLPGRNVAIAVDDERSDAAVVVVLAECADGGDPAVPAAEIRRVVFDRMNLTLHAVQLLPRGSLAKTTSGKISRVENKKMYVERSFPVIVAT